MKLCLDVGNSHIYGGVFESGRVLMTFRKASKLGSSSDEYGLFFRSVLRENGIDPNQVTAIALCSVVPEVVYAISAACQKSPSVLSAVASGPGDARPSSSRSRLWKTKARASVNAVLGTPLRR